MLILSRKFSYNDPITLANLTMSSGLFSKMSVKSSDTCSDSIDCPELSLSLVLSIEDVRAFLITNGSS